jgi:hypothetical protein
VIRQSSATTFPLPLWGRDRERVQQRYCWFISNDPTSPAKCSQPCRDTGTSLTLSVRGHPSPCPSPQGLRHAHISGRRAYGARCEGARHMVPSPLVGEGQGEGWPQSTEDEAPPDWRTVNGCRAGLIGSVDTNQKQRCYTPLPVPPPQGGGNVVALLCPSPSNAPACGSEMCACHSPQGGREPCGAHLRHSPPE